MKQKITLSLSDKSVKFVKKYAKERKSSVSEITDHYFETLRKIEEANTLNKKKDAFVEKFGGVFNTGSKDIMKEIFGGK